MPINIHYSKETTAKHESEQLLLRESCRLKLHPKSPRYNPVIRRRCRTAHVGTLLCVLLAWFEIVFRSILIFSRPVGKCENEVLCGASVFDEHARTRPPLSKESKISWVVWYEYSRLGGIVETHHFTLELRKTGLLNNFLFSLILEKMLPTGKLKSVK